MSTEQAQLTIDGAMRKYAAFGAMDSEGYHAVMRVERAAREGQPFPLRGTNPFDLYRSVSGWEDASAELIKAARELWMCLLEERLGILIVRE